MRLVRFLYNEKIEHGVIENNTINILSGSYFDEINLSGKTVSINDVKILPPTCPTKIVAVGMNYKDHIKEMGHDTPDHPIIFIKPSTAVIGHKDSIIIPDCSNRVDYEAEFAVVIKKKCKNVNASDANDYIFGYTCLNDVTARDIQKLDGQWTRAKSFDTFAPIGPFIDDELDPNNTDIKLYLNGEIKQHSNTKEFLFKVDYLISFISSVMTLNKGDIITTGTSSGISKMQDGDQVEIVLNDDIRLLNFVTEGKKNYGN